MMYNVRYVNIGSMDGLKPRLHQIVSTCIPCRRLHVSCIGDKIVVTAACIHLYPQVEHCLELVSVYMYPATGI